MGAKDRSRPEAALKLLSKAATNARITGSSDVQSTYDKRSRSGPPNRRPNDESVYLRAWNQRRQPGDEVQWLENHIGGAIVVDKLVELSDWWEETLTKIQLPGREQFFPELNQSD